ncbi:MAG: LysR family transcriptional regulator [Psychrobacter sp.]|nr:LysR family transcriptional regulator [Psychrobacter sp.]
MDWGDLVFFICLVEEQTLTASAEKLGVQHSTVSRRIDRLESRLGLKLFNRLGKRYQLTEEGEYLYAQAIEVQKQVNTFERLAYEQNALQGSVVISAPPVLANELLIKAIPTFKEKYPDIVLHLRGDLHISDLHRKEADIALRLQRPEQEDLLIRTIGQVKYGFFTHRHYIEHTPKGDWQLIEFSANNRLANWLQLLVSDHGYTIGLSSNDLYVTYSAACKQLGIAILPLFLAAKYTDLVPINPLTKTIMTSLDAEHTANDTIYENEDDSMGNLTTNLKTVPLLHSRPLYIVMHPDVRRSARVSVVAEWLGKAISI